MSSPYRREHPVAARYGTQVARATEGQPSTKGTRECLVIRHPHLPRVTLPTDEDSYRRRRGATSSIRVVPLLSELGVHSPTGGPSVISGATVLDLLLAAPRTAR